MDEPAEKPKKTTRMIPIDQIHPGPILRSSLPNPIVERIDDVRRVFQEVYPQTLAEWVDTFQRDLHYERELLLWETMAQVFAEYCEVHETTLELRKEVYAAVLTRTFGSGEEELRQLNPKLLSRKDVFALWESFGRVYAEKKKASEGPDKAEIS